MRDVIFLCLFLAVFIIISCVFSMVRIVWVL